MGKDKNGSLQFLLQWSQNVSKALVKILYHYHDQGFTQPSYSPTTVINARKEMSQLAAISGI
jgi:hypothetical protein